MIKSFIEKVLEKFGNRILHFSSLSLFSILFLIKSLENSFIQDDAFTSLRYVKNFVEGNGLVFNIGERVEGYTNFLWVILLSGFYSLEKFGIWNLDLETTAQILSTVFGIVIIWVTYFLSRQFIKDKSDSLLKNLASLLPSFLIAVSGPMIYWSVSGMETSLFISLTLLSFWFYLRNLKNEHLGFGFIIISFLNSLLRPEGLIFFGLIVFHKFLTSVYNSEENNFIKRAFVFFNKKIIYELALFTILTGVYLSFRYLYYGYFLPNTFYAKTDFSIEFLQRGIRYFIDFSKTNLLYGVLLVSPLTFLFTKEINKKISFYFFMIFIWIALVIFIGGDVLPVHRFFLPVLPLIFILNIAVLEYLIGLIKKSFLRDLSFAMLIFVTVIYGLWNYNFQMPSIQNFRSYEVGLVKKMKIYVRWINEQNNITTENESKNESTSKSPPRVAGGNAGKIIDDKSKYKLSVAMSTIGAFSFYSDAQVIDIVGLTDEYIAHNPKEVEGINDELPVLWKERRYNAEYVLSRKPDYIIFPAGAKPSAFAECALFVQNDFHKEYYTQLIYSRELNQLLPIFSRRNENDQKLTSRYRRQGGKEYEQDQEHEQEKIKEQNCEVRFVKHYINAVNLFLNMTENRSYSLLKEIISECNSVIQYCPDRIGDAETIKGYALYHSGNQNRSKLFFENSIKHDSLNMISRYYLKNIYFSEKDTTAAINQLRYLQKYSPGIFQMF